MKALLVAALAVYSFTVVIPVTVYAYNYTCAEGRFTIDVPEGWEVKVRAHGRSLLLGRESNDKTWTYEFDISWLSTKDEEWKYEIGEKYYEGKFTIDSMYNSYIERLGPDRSEYPIKWVNYEEARKMNIEAGFINTPVIATYGLLAVNAYLVKSERVYVFGTYYPAEPVDSPLNIDFREREMIKNSAIKMFNSFRALD